MNLEDRPITHFPRYLTPLAPAAVAEAEAAGLGAGPVPYTLTPLAAAVLEDTEEIHAMTSPVPGTNVAYVRYEPTAYDLGITDIDPEAEPYGPDLPTRKDLDLATAASSYALADPEAGGAERLRVLEAEEATFLAYAQRPGAEAELEAGI